MLGSGTGGETQALDALSVAFLCLAPGAGCSSVLVHCLPVAWAGPGVEEKLTRCWSYFIREDRSSLPPNPRPVLEPWRPDPVPSGEPHSAAGP